MKIDWLQAFLYKIYTTIKKQFFSVHEEYFCASSWQALEVICRILSDFKLFKNVVYCAELNKGRTRLWKRLYYLHEAKFLAYFLYIAGFCD